MLAVKPWSFPASTLIKCCPLEINRLATDCIITSVEKTASDSHACMSHPQEHLTSSLCHILNILHHGIPKRLIYYSLVLAI
jgi:hypothetical protein